MTLTNNWQKRGPTMNKYQQGYLQALEDILYETTNSERVGNLDVMNWLLRHMIDNVSSE